MQDTTRMLREALDRVAPVGRHAILIGEALRNGGLLDVPSDKQEFRKFVDGPLLHAARSLLGKESAKELVGVLLQMLLPPDAGKTLSGTLPLNAPPPVSTPRAPTPAKPAVSETLAYGGGREVKKESTLPYGGDEPRRRIDVALIESDSKVAAHLTEVLEGRDYRVLSPKRDNVVSLCRQMSIGLVFVGQHHAEVLAELGALDDVPPVVYISDDIEDRPKGVIAVLPRDAPKGLIEALDAAVRYGNKI